MVYSIQTSLVTQMESAVCWLREPQYHFGSVGIANTFGHFAFAAYPTITSYHSHPYGWSHRNGILLLIDGGWFAHEAYIRTDFLGFVPVI